VTGRTSPSAAGSRFADARALQRRGVPFARALRLARRPRPRLFSVAYLEEFSHAAPHVSDREAVRFMARGRAGLRAPTARPAVVRRTPAARPAARRPRTSASRSSSRAGPDDDSGEPEPPGELAGRRLNKITTNEPLLVRIGRDFTAAGIAPDAQLVRVNASPRWMQNALWRDLREHIERERAT